MQETGSNVILFYFRKQKNNNYLGEKQRCNKTDYNYMFPVTNNSGTYSRCYSSLTDPVKTFPLVIIKHGSALPLFIFMYLEA